MSKKLQYLILTLSFVTISLSYSQETLNNNSNKQLKVSISMEYKLPLLMKPFKKIFPKKGELYVSDIGNRLESNTKFLGNQINSIGIENYAKGVAIEYAEIHKKDTLIKHLNITDLIIDTNSSIYIGDKTKKILNYNCKNFIIQTDTTEIEGFLTEDLVGTGMLITGKDYGFPLEYKETYKNSKMIKSIFVKTEKIIEQAFDSTTFIINKE